MPGSVPNVANTTARHRKAVAEAARRDGVWFGRNPTRCFRARRSIPYEVAAWGPHDHEAKPWMIVRTNWQREEWERRPVSTTADRPLDDDEDLLASVWAIVDERASEGEMVKISPLQHALLLPAVGES